MNREYWLNQSKSFDKSSDYYDQFRPSYPKQLIEDIIKEANVNEDSKILEIGAGSGKATEQFVNKGLNITCIEPGANLAEKGMLKFKNINQVKYIVSRFEEWDEKPASYNLIFSAQAFHWVEKPMGYEKCFRTLKDGGYLALFWNYYLETEEQYDVELKELFKKYPLGYLDTKEDLDNKIRQNIEEINSSGYFKDVKVIGYPWQLDYDTESYIGFLKTSNGYITLNESLKAEAEKEARDIILRNGGRITRNFICTLYLAMKK